jgi:response regulator RpfG family c-di-GMP phosphodiesterase
MDCEQTLAQISALIDGEIAASDREQLEAHLELCARCRQALEDFRRHDEALRRELGPWSRDAAAFAGQMKARLLGRDPAPWPRCSLLIVDDESYLLSMLAELLGREFEVLTAASAEEAVEIFQRRPIDLVLSDQRMPRRTGVQLLEWVHQHHPRTVRLLMTAYAELETAVEAINRGQVYHYILKPWRNLDELLQPLRNAAEKCVLERSRELLLDELRQLNRQLEERVADRTRKLEEANRLLEQRAADLEKLALTDPLTGLNNRRAMEQLVSWGSSTSTTSNRSTRITCTPAATRCCADWPGC